ncbi:unnamed protein product [Polarella glacialis]|uniref:EF-hand domain-containing protein n=1 Tax=Polarella glacialis TaxID=89957 RepID=A0A813F932_POLGL|nr:unnamed protein product [Polarella glacialis]
MNSGGAEALPAEGEIAAAVSAAVQEVLASRSAADTQEVLVSAEGAGSSIRSRQSAASPDTEVPEPEPWAVTLLENADKLRYACYALRIASSLGADVATTGLGGQEVVKLCFVSVDALLTSSWLAWFTSSLLDDSPGSNVIRQTMALDFAGGPSAVISQVDAICMNMNPADRVHVIQLTMALKRRIAVIVGDLCSMMMTKDAAVTSAMVTELLVQLQPVDASHGLQCLVAWYGMIPEERRGILEDSDRLNELLSSATSNLGDAVQREYDLPLSRKALNASRRHAPLLAFEVVAMVTPAAPLATAMAAAHLAGSLAISANVGRDSCEDARSSGWDSEIFGFVLCNPGALGTLLRRAAVACDDLCFMVGAQTAARACDGLCFIVGRIGTIGTKLLHRSFADADTSRNKHIGFLEFALWYSRHGFMENVLLTDQQRELRAIARRNNIPVTEVEQYKRKFDIFDEDDSGAIDYAEFEKLLNLLVKVPAHCELNASRIKRFWMETDKNKDGALDFEAFLHFYQRPSTPHQGSPALPYLRGFFE